MDHWNFESITSYAWSDFISFLGKRDEHSLVLQSTSLLYAPVTPYAHSTVVNWGWSLHLLNQVSLCIHAGFIATTDTDAALFNYNIPEGCTRINVRQVDDGGFCRPHRSLKIPLAWCTLASHAVPSRFFLIIVGRVISKNELCDWTIHL